MDGGRNVTRPWIQLISMFLPMLVVLLNLESGIYHERQKTPDVWTTKQDCADVEDSTLTVLQSGLPCLDKNCAGSRYFSAKCLTRLSSSFSRRVE